MLTIEKTVLPSPEQWEIVIEGMRNPMNSWDKIDSQFYLKHPECPVDSCPLVEPYIGEKDHKLMTSLNKGGTEHSKYRRMIPVWVTVNAPLYWWKEADTYTIGKVQSSCSTMHKIHEKEFTLNDFSIEHLCEEDLYVFEAYLHRMEANRKFFLAFADSEEKKEFWYRMIQLLPTSYNQKRTLMVNYEVLAKMYRERKNHKLDEWHVFCDWIKTLPYSELITMEV